VIRLDILRGCAEILFRKIPYDIATNNITKEVFCQYSRMIFPQYSDDEIEYIYEYQIMDRPLGVFEVICEFAYNVLAISNNTIVCEHKDALRWRDISVKLGQDIFTTVFLAKNDILNGTKTNEFLWPSIIGVNNEKLNSILNEGMAENHFHLNGSSRIFHLSFTCIMNYIEDRQSDFNKLKFYLDSNNDINTNERIKKSLYHQCIIAAAIRLYLNCIVEDTMWIVDSSDINFEKLDDIDASKISDLQHLINIYKNEYGYKDNKNYEGSFCTSAFLIYLMVVLATKKKTIFINI
jgi:hypothetical protein